MYFSRPTDPEVLQKLTKRLDPAKLLSLASDILSNRRHRSVKITDGPGDGGRDVHSVGPSREPWVTQCKFHERSDATASSSELGELPLALVKRGLTHGLFITNAKISPQAKREYLDGFPGLRLDFLDGISLVRELHSSAILSALWLTSLALPVTYAFPVIVRCHSDDSPYFLKEDERTLHRTALSTMEAFADIDVTFADATFDDSPFEPYRLPDSPQQHEGLFLPFRGIECQVRGRVSLADIPIMAQHVASAIAKFLRADGHAISVCVGTPTATPLGGEDAGARIRLEPAPQTVVATPEYLGPEEAFVDLDHPHWSSETDANTTEAIWIRLYARDIDAAANAEIHSPVTRSYKLLKRTLRAHGIEQWKKSVQALLPSWSDSWPYDDLDEPDETVAWPWGSLTLCGWLDDISPHRVRELKASLGKIQGAELVTPDVARHMLGVLGNDPFPDTEVFRFDTAALSLGFKDSGVPSPTRPESRRLSATMCFRYDTTLTNVLEALFHDESPIYGGHEASVDDHWIRLDIDVAQDFLNPRSTASALGSLHKWLTHLLTLLPVGVKPETAQYWYDQYGVRLGTSPYDSDKIYSWTVKGDQFQPIKTRDFLQSDDEAAAQPCNAPDGARRRR